MHRLIIFKCHIDVAQIACLLHLPYLAYFRAHDLAYCYSRLIIAILSWNDASGLFDEISFIRVYSGMSKLPHTQVANGARCRTLTGLHYSFIRETGNWRPLKPLSVAEIVQNQAIISADRFGSWERAYYMTITLKDGWCASRSVRKYSHPRHWVFFSAGLRFRSTSEDRYESMYFTFQLDWNWLLTVSFSLML